MSSDYERPLVPQTSATRARERQTPDRASHADAARRPTRDAGEPLDAATRSDMEGAFGRDFGDVRLHSDHTSAESARALGADAYSLGSDVVFGKDQLAPNTSSGKRLLAHELAHVAQQDGHGRAAPSPGETQTARLESDANRAATAAVSGNAAAVHEHAPAGVPLRQATTTDPGAAGKSATKPRREQRFNVGRPGRRVDAELNRDASILTVTMKLKFVPVNKPLPWPSPAKFEDFKSKFMTGVSKRWSFKHYLVPAGSCPDEPQLVSVLLNLVPVTSGEHATVNVGYTKDYQQSSVRGNAPTADLDVLDVDERGDHPQTPGEHEFGHMLGLPHIHCDTNDPDCYGTNYNEKMDIMGVGSFVSPRDYEPFAEMMSYFTGCNYNVKQASQIPTSRKADIGGAIGFLAGGLIGGLIGAALGPIGLIAGLAIGAVGGFFAGRGLGTLAMQP